MRRAKGATKDGTTATRGGSGNKDVVWELRPGGMLVQKRGACGVGQQGCAAAASTNSNSGSSNSPMVRIRVSHGSYQHELCVPAYSTFGELKRTLVPDTGLEPQQQRLLFKGKEKDDHERLHMAGVRDDTGPARVVLMEDPASKERRMRELTEKEEATRASAAVAGVRAEVDKLAGKVSALEQVVNRGTKVADKELGVLIELLMMQLLKLDAVEAEGEAKMQRRYEVRRIQRIVDTLDALKAKNCNPFIGATATTGAAVPVSTTTKWEAFSSGVGSMSAPPPRAPLRTTTTITHNWETFE